MCLERLRSETFPGLADAIAEQWGALLLNPAQPDFFERFAA